MAELDKILLTALGGFVVLVVGQVAQRWYIEPLQAQRSVIGRIRYALIFYADIYSNPGTSRTELMDEAARELRRLAAELHVTAELIPSYGWLSLMGAIPSRKAVEDASSCLIGLSNSVHRVVGGEDRPQERRQTILAALESRDGLGRRCRDWLRARWRGFGRRARGNAISGGEGIG